MNQIDLFKNYSYLIEILDATLFRIVRIMKSYLKILLFIKDLVQSKGATCVSPNRANPFQNLPLVLNSDISFSKISYHSKAKEPY